MANYRAYAQFTANKTGKTGLSDVTVVAYDGLTGNSITTSGSATHLGKGIYQYTIQSATEIEPVGVFVTADTTVDQQEVPFLVTKEIVHGSQTGEYTTALTAIQADLDNPAQYKADVSALATQANLNAVKAKTDNLPSSPAASGEYTTKLDAIKAKTDTITTPPTTAQIADAVWTRTTRTITTTIPTAANIASSVWSNATRTLTTSFPTPPTPAQIATAVWAETVRTLTSYPTQLTQADIRQAVGLIAANLDSQLAGLDTKIDDLPAPDNTGITAIKTKTDQLTYTEGKVNANATVNTSGLATETTLNAVKAKTDQLTFVNNKVDANATATVDTSGLALETTQQGILSMLTSDPLPVRIDGIVGSTITATRGNDWMIPIDGLTLDGKIQLAIKRNDNQPDDRSALFVDSVTGLITVNGKPTIRSRRGRA